MRVSDLKDANHNYDRSVDDSITVTINLLNVDEEGLVDLSSTEPSEGQALTATLTDPDGSLSGITWQWARASIEESGWTDITGATSSTYTPVSDDGGMFLRATASYTDGEGSGKSASKVSSNTVQTLAGVDTTLKSLRFNKIPFWLNGVTLDYTISVPNSISQIKVKTVASAESGVTVAISPADSSATKQGHQINLSEGDNEINVVVSDDNGGASTTYVIMIDRRGSSETLSSSCDSDLSAFLVSHCGAGDFADYRVELDGSYTIDWSDWSSEHPGVNAYSVSLERFIYRTYHRRNGGASVSPVGQQIRNLRVIRRALELPGSGGPRPPCGRFRRANGYTHVVDEPQAQPVEFRPGNARIHIGASKRSSGGMETRRPNPQR